MWGDRGGAVECLVGGEGTEVRCGPSGWELGVFTAEAALRRNLSDLPICSTWAPPSATPWKLWAVTGAPETKQDNHNAQINQSECEWEYKIFWGHVQPKCKQYYSMQVWAGQSHHCSYFLAFESILLCIHAWKFYRDSIKSIYYICFLLLIRVIIWCLLQIQIFYQRNPAILNVTAKCAGSPYCGQMRS